MKVTTIDIELTDQQIEFIKRYSFYTQDGNYPGRFQDSAYSFYWDNYKEYFHDVRLQLVNLGLIDAVFVSPGLTMYRLTKIGEQVWGIVRSGKVG